MAKKLKPFIPKRRDQTEDNQWLQKELFKELPLDEVTPYSQLYVLQRTDRGDGVYFRPVRASFEDIFSFNTNSIDEGNPFSEYLLSDELDEGGPTSTYSGDELDEGGSDTVYY